MPYRGVFSCKKLPSGTLSRETQPVGPQSVGPQSPAATSQLVPRVSAAVLAGPFPFEKTEGKVDSLFFGGWGTSRDIPLMGALACFGEGPAAQERPKKGRRMNRRPCWNKRLRKGIIGCFFVFLGDTSPSQLCCNAGITAPRLPPAGRRSPADNPGQTVPPAPKCRRWRSPAAPPKRT